MGDGVGDGGGGCWVDGWLGYVSIKMWNRFEAVGNLETY